MIGRWRRGSALVQAGFDGLVWAIGLIAATALRYDFSFTASPIAGFALIVPLAMLCQLDVGLLVGLYRGGWRYGSFEEVAGMVRSALITTLLVYALNLWLVGHLILPRGAIPVAGVLAILGMGGTRYISRLASEAHRRLRNPAAERVLVFGAGEAGAQAVTAMVRDPAGTYVPVALLDDDPAKRGTKIMGVPVVGNRSSLELAATKYQSQTLLIAIASAEGSLISELTAAGQELGLAVLVLPPVKDLFGSAVALADMREVSESDLLGRHRVETDVNSIAGYLSGRRILVTGAGGSIGSELCRQIHAFAPAELVMLDRDESALHAVQLSIEGKALLESANLKLVDIRDRDRIQQVFRDTRPEVVFHAAALKHLTLLERNPGEAIKTNIFGTLHLLQIAAEYGTEKFVNISTDKAADPISILGHSKRLAERLTSWQAHATGRTFLSVRFGNVLGSRGSMLGTFQAQIARGGPLTVTSPDATRFFMTVQEAVQLVIQAGAIGKPGEVLVLDMGDPVRIADVANLLIARADADITILYTGLRAGEKVHEVLFGAGELDSRPVHPMISHVLVPPFDPADLDQLVTQEAQAAQILRSLSGGSAEVRYPTKDIGLETRPAKLSP